MDHLTIKNIIERLKSPSPTFFKKMRWLMGILGGLGASLIIAKASSEPYLDYIPSWLISILVTCGTLGTFLTSLPVYNINENNIK